MRMHVGSRLTDKPINHHYIYNYDDYNTKLTYNMI